MYHEQEVPPPLTDDVVVWLVMKDGRRIESRRMPGVIADLQKHRLAGTATHHAYEDLSEIDWLPEAFDLAEVAEVGVEYRPDR